MALKIQIETIPHNEQRYATCGDWWWGTDASWQFRVSDLGNWRWEMCVAIHELVECALCRFHGVSSTDVDKFDRVYEAKRVEGDYSEPGDHPDSPYRFEHCVATGVERIVAALLGVKWSEYESRINSL